MFHAEDAEEDAEFADLLSVLCEDLCALSVESSAKTTAKTATVR